jgi:hypothetical protein
MVVDEAWDTSARLVKEREQAEAERRIADRVTKAIDDRLFFYFIGIGVAFVVINNFI